MTLSVDRTIINLDEMVQGLDHERRRRFEELFSVNVTHGILVPPEQMLPWIEKQFGAVEQTTEQKIVRVTNNVTSEGVLFNWLRSSRPMWKAPVNLDNELESMGAADPLAHPLTGTPEDIFGRVRGKYCVTASNIAKFDGFHGLVIFDERHPLRWNREQVHDYINTAHRWALLANETDPEAIYYLFIWNCLWRAGASLLHGHAQMMLGKGMHYAKVEHLRRSALMYQTQFRRNYFHDLFEAHEDVDSGFERPDGVRVMAHLTPIKESEVILLADQSGPALNDAIYETLRCFRDELNVTSFNLVQYQRPFGGHDSEENWDGFPVMVRIVDRGDSSSRTVDFGAMELYAASVVSSDPFRVARTLKQSMGLS